MWEQTEKAKIRLAAKHATAVRDAVVASVDVDEIVKTWLATHPAPDTSADDARTWAGLNVVVDETPLAEVLATLYGDSWVLGTEVAERALLKQPVRKALFSMKAAKLIQNVDWANWTAGNRGAAALLQNPPGLHTLMSSRMVTLKGISKTTTDRIGTELASALATGAAPRQARNAVTGLLQQEISGKLKKGVKKIVADPERALMIAQTEMSRATSIAARNSYEMSGVEFVKWLVAKGCKICQANHDVGPIPIDGTFPSGDAEPPAHPYCMCALTPYIADLDEIGEEELDASFREVEEGTPTKLPNFVVNPLTPEEAEQIKEVVESYGAGGYTRINGTLRGKTEAEMKTVFWSDYTRSELKKELALMDRAMEVAQPLEKELVTYRGVKGRLADALDELKVGDEYTDLAFMSTSTSPKVAQAFSFGTNSKIMKIVNPKGSKGLDMSKFIDDAEYESEFVLPRGSRLRVVSIVDNVFNMEVIP